MSKLKARYVGDGYYHGIPKRDLTEKDWEGLTDDQKALVKQSPIYEIVVSKKTTKDGE